MSRTDTEILDHQPTSPSLPSSGSKATPTASPVGVVSAEILELLRLARTYVPSLSALALRIDDVLGKPDCRFCGSTLHWSGDCRAFRPTGKRP